MKAGFRKMIVAALAGAALLTAGGMASAADLFEDVSGMGTPWDGTRWLVRGRVIGMLPDENDGRVGGAPANLGVDDDVMPELDFTYFFNNNFAAELILGATHHDVDLAGTKITDLWVLPPTLTLQYHLPMGAFKPYVGAGVNYTTILSSDATSAIGSDSWEDSFGFALQAGFDWAIDDRWSFNVDVKKIFLNLDAKVGAANTPASVDLDPWVVGVGVGYRF